MRTQKRIDALELAVGLDLEADRFALDRWAELQAANPEAAARLKGQFENDQGFMAMPKDNPAAADAVMAVAARRKAKTYQGISPDDWD